MVSPADNMAHTAAAAAQHFAIRIAVCLSRPVVNYGSHVVEAEERSIGYQPALAEAQLELVADGIRRVWAAFPAATTAVVTGLGDFIAAEAARRAGLEVVALDERLGAAARTAPAAAVAWLLADEPATAPG